MQDIKTLFSVNRDHKIEIVTSDERGFSGKVEDVQDNHVLLVCDDGRYCIFYRQIIFVKLG